MTPAPFTRHVLKGDQTEGRKIRYGTEVRQKYRETCKYEAFEG